MLGGGSDYRFVDTGNAPEFFANGLHNVEVMGPVARFVLYVVRFGSDGSRIAEPPFTCVMPIEAIGPGIALTLRACPGLVIPALGQAALCLIN